MLVSADEDLAVHAAIDPVTFSRIEFVEISSNFRLALNTKAPPPWLTASQQRSAITTTEDQFHHRDAGAAICGYHLLRHLRSNLRAFNPPS